MEACSLHKIIHLSPLTNVSVLIIYNCRSLAISIMGESRKVSLSIFEPYIPPYTDLVSISPPRAEALRLCTTTFSIFASWLGSPTLLHLSFTVHPIDPPNSPADPCGHPCMNTQQKIILFLSWSFAVCFLHSFLLQ